MKYLPPMILTESLYAPIEAVINAMFERMLFAPIRAALLGFNIEISNARPARLEQAISEGRVYFNDGRLYGKFNASVSKELMALGAKYSSYLKSWSLPAGAALPAGIQMAIAAADARSAKATRAVLYALDNINLIDDRTPEELKEQYGKAVWRMNEQFLATTRTIAIAPELTPAQHKIITDEWAENLDLYIRGWAEEAILDLRQTVQANTLRGQRAENLVKEIQKTHAVSKTKAKFLARQETSLLMSKMRETRYGDLGLVEYKWTGADDERERPDHRLLNGKIFRFDQPPVTNRATGARNNPGEDYGCRCLAVPVLRG